MSTNNSFFKFSNNPYNLREYECRISVKWNQIVTWSTVFSQGVIDSWKRLPKGSKTDWTIARIGEIERYLPMSQTSSSIK